MLGRVLAVDEAVAAILADAEGLSEDFVAGTVIAIRNGHLVVTEANGELSLRITQAGRDCFGKLEESFAQRPLAPPP